MLIVYAWVVEDNVFNRMVAEEAAHIEQSYQQHGVLPEPRSRFMTLYPSWSDLPENIQLLRSQSPDRVEFPLPDGGTVHLTTLQLGPQQMVLAADVSAFEVSRDYFPTVIGWLLMILGGVCLMAFLLSRRVSDVAVKPVESLARLVDEREAGKPVAFANRFSRDEVGYLAQTIEDNINQLQAVLNRESRFTRDVSHELRTPATVLTLLSDQLDQEGTLSEQQKAEFRQSVQQFTQTVSALLALARQESMEQQSVNLLEEIEFCVINHFRLSANESFEISVNVPADYRVPANRNLLHILLNNLIDNALNHGNGNRLSIDLKDNALSFINTTDGVELADIFDRKVKRTSSEGLGLGLNLIRRICSVSGWEADAKNDGTLFALTIQFEPS